MEVDKNLRADLLSPLETIESIEVKYPKKIIFSGMVAELKQAPLELVISQRNPKSAEEKFHEVDFNKAIEIVIRFYDGKISVHHDSKFTD